MKVIQLGEPKASSGGHRPLMLVACMLFIWGLVTGLDWAKLSAIPELRGVETGCWKMVTQ